MFGPWTPLAFVTATPASASRSEGEVVDVGRPAGEQT